MRAILVVLSILLWASPSLAEQESPDGFGPIKFGMTKEEAWEAIDGQGHWENDELLAHKVGLPEFMKDYYEVIHFFEGGLANAVRIKARYTKELRELCSIHVGKIVNIVQNKYRINATKVSDWYSSIATDVYYFHFPDGSNWYALFARGTENVSSGPKQLSCIVTIEITPPQQDWIGGF